MSRAPIILVLCALALAGCGNGDATCSTNADCFKGEVCSADDVCVADPDAPSNNGTSNASPNSSPNGETNGATGTNGKPDVEGVCIVDPFTATCDMPDDNDSTGEYIRMEPGPPGCDGSGNEFAGNEVTVEGLQMCATETRDIYDTNLIPCDDKTFVIEVTLTPKQDCDPDRYALDVNVQGNDCEEPNDRVRCETLEDGRKRVTAMVDPSISIAVAKMYIDKNVESMQFDYDLDIVVRE